MNYAFRSSTRRIIFCIALGLIGSRLIFDLFTERGVPRSLPQFVVFGVLFVALFFLAERAYSRLFFDRNPKEQMEFLEQKQNEK